MESCRYIDVNLGSGYPGNEVVKEWARMATVAMTLNYYLNFDLNSTNMLNYISEVQLVPPSTP